MSGPFTRLEDIVSDPVFPEVDVALRRGRHIDRDDGDLYQLLVDAQDLLEEFYRRYRCELMQQSDGYFYLLPLGEQVSHRYLSAGEMLVGQTLALYYLDPAKLQTAGTCTRTQLLARLTSLVGVRELSKALEPRRRNFDDERVVHGAIRTKVGTALRRLVSLGFADLLDPETIRPRAAVLRFAEPVRGLQDMEAALARLVASGQIGLCHEGDGDADEAEPDSEERDE
jgi:chromosome partition protein MukE